MKHSRCAHPDKARWTPCARPELPPPVERALPPGRLLREPVDAPHRSPSWPPWRSTAGPKADTQCVTTEVASALPSVSYKPVLPRKSANKMLRSEICVMGTPV